MNNTHTLYHRHYTGRSHLLHLATKGFFLCCKTHTAFLKINYLYFSLDFCHSSTKKKMKKYKAK